MSQPISTIKHASEIYWTKVKKWWNWTFPSEEHTNNETQYSESDNDLPPVASPRSILLLWKVCGCCSLFIFIFCLHLIWFFDILDNGPFVRIFNSKHQNTMNVVQILLLELYPTFDLEDAHLERIKATSKVHQCFYAWWRSFYFSLWCFLYVYFIP